MVAKKASQIDEKWQKEQEQKLFGAANVQQAVTKVKDNQP